MTVLSCVCVCVLVKGTSSSSLGACLPVRAGAGEQQYLVATCLSARELGDFGAWEGTGGCSHSLVVAMRLQFYVCPVKSSRQGSELELAAELEATGC